jgi:hypothetical protein
MGEHEDADRRRDERDELVARAAAGRERSRRLATQVSEAAGGVAYTEDRMADQLDRVAADAAGDTDRADRLREQADQARSFARHERAEQGRWERVAEGERDN